MSLPDGEFAAAKQEATRLSSQLARANGKNEALAAAIGAAESSMRALKLAREHQDKSQLSQQVKILLEKAEQIKVRPDWRSVIHSGSSSTGNERASETAAATISSSTASLKVPVSTREPTRKEKILLLKASFLHGFKFPPSDSRPAVAEFELNDDSPDLTLSELQEDVFDAWKRPADALPPPSWRLGHRPDLVPTMDARDKIDLVQDAASDCSVVASLCAAVARLDRGYSRITKTVLYPFDHERDIPVLSGNGKYVSLLNFNGCFRRVVIDDRLPTSSDGRVIHVVDRGNPSLLWPALIEKAYLKVRGGYDFPGSNSGTDLWILTGWIPEQIFLQSDELEPDRFWRRIYNGFKYGDVLVTMGTGKTSSRTERELGLPGEHDYAVLDLREVDGQRLMLIKNPWCESTSWRGTRSLSEQSDTSSEHFQTDTTDTYRVDEPVANPRDLLNAQDQLSPGTFWMDLANVMQYFETIYLNWNPGLFKFRQDLHFSWDLATVEDGSSMPRGRFASLCRHPQLTVATQNGGMIWLLLCRHFQNSVPADATPEEIEADRYGIELSGHMMLLAFSSSGRRVLLPDKALEKGWFVDSPQTLLKLDDCKPGERYTLVPVEQELPAINHTFTISTFSNSPIMLEEASPRLPHMYTLNGAWTKDTAGGNAHSPTYSTNPQFAITIAKRTKLTLLLEAMNDELNIHVKLVYGQGKRVYAVRNKDIVFDSRDYRRGCCVAETEALEAGQYTIICSTFEPNQLGQFRLLVESSIPVYTILLPREGAGRVRLEPGRVHFEPGQTSARLPLIPKRLTKLYAISRHVDGSLRGTHSTPLSGRSLVRMTIETGREPNRRILATSNGGEFTDCIGGIRTNDIDLGPEARRFGDVSLVLDRMVAGPEAYEELFGVELLVDQLSAVEYGAWQAVDD